MGLRGVFLILVTVLFISLSSAAYYNSSATNITECGTIGEGGVYEVLGDIFSGSDCIIVGSNDIEIRGNNFALIGNLSGTGIIVKSLNNFSVEGLKIENFYRGIALKNSTNSRILNVLLENNSLSGLWIYAGSRNNLIDNLKVLGGSSGIVFNYAENNVLSDSSILSGNDIDMESSPNNQIINTTYLTGSISSDSSVTKKSYLFVNVSYLNGQLNGANVSVTDENNLTQSSFTDSKGIASFILEEYENNGSIYLKNNYIIVVSASGYSDNISHIILNGSMEMKIVLNVIPPAQDNTQTGGGGGGGGSCYSEWTCTLWTDCINGVQSRICSLKVPSCIPEPKPAESQACSTTNTLQNISQEISNNSSENKLGNSAPITASVIGGLTNPKVYVPILFITAIVILFVALNIFRKKKN